MSRRLAPEELAQIAAAVLGGSPLPAFVLEMPSERIVATTLRASQMLDPGPGMVIGFPLHKFTVDRPAAGDELVAGGRLNGLETFRVLRREHGPNVSIRMWVRSFDSQQPSSYVLVLVVADQPAAGPTDPSSHSSWSDQPAVLGIADAGLVIERISSDAESLFAVPLTDLVGRSLLSLVAEPDVVSCRSGVAEAAALGRGVTLNLRVGAIRADSDQPVEAVRCETLILPLQPAPSCAFVFLPTPLATTGVSMSTELSALLGRLGRGAEIAKLARGVFGLSERQVPGLSRLTIRELEVVARLLEGDRPPVIAARLSLSQSTIRNHLAAAYGKLGVSSQQGLLDMFRAARSSAERRRAIE